MEYSIDAGAGAGETFRNLPIDSTFYSANLNELHTLILLKKTEICILHVCKIPQTCTRNQINNLRGMSLSPSLFLCTRACVWLKNIHSRCTYFFDVSQIHAWTHAYCGRRCYSKYSNLLWLAHLLPSANAAYVSPRNVQFYHNHF